MVRGGEENAKIRAYSEFSIGGFEAKIWPNFKTPITHYREFETDPPETSLSMGVSPNSLLWARGAPFEPAEEGVALLEPPRKPKRV